VIRPTDFKVKSEANKFSIPYEKFIVDKEEPETFKLLSDLVIHNMGWGYTCFVTSFAVFVSDKEIKCHKSQVISKFNYISSVADFEGLSLPISNVTHCSDGSENRAYEFDLTKKNRLKSLLKISKLDCYPVLWVKSTPS